MAKIPNTIRLKYIGPDNSGLGLEHEKVYTVSLCCSAGYIVVMWNTNECLYPSLADLNGDWSDI